MAKFSVVFGTTLKVVAALFIISLIGGVIYAIARGIGDAASTTPVSSRTLDAKLRDPWDQEADERHAKLPASKWSNLVQQGVKQRCAFKGMSQDEVKKVLGNPSKIDQSSLGDFWTYTAEDRSRCHTYNGEKCVQFEQNSEMLQFSPAGHVKLDDDGPGCLKEPLFSRLMSIR